MPCFYALRTPPRHFCRSAASVHRGRTLYHHSGTSVIFPKIGHTPHQMTALKATHRHPPSPHEVHHDQEQNHVAHHILCEAPLQGSPPDYPSVLAGFHNLHSQRHFLKGRSPHTSRDSSTYAGRTVKIYCQMKIQIPRWERTALWGLVKDIFPVDDGKNRVLCMCRCGA